MLCLPLFIPLLFPKSFVYQLQTGLGCFDISSVRFPAVLLKAVQDIDNSLDFGSFDFRYFLIQEFNIFYFI